MFQKTLLSSAILLLILTLQWHTTNLKLYSVCSRVTATRMHFVLLSIHFHLGHHNGWVQYTANSIVSIGSRLGSVLNRSRQLHQTMDAIERTVRSSIHYDTWAGTTPGQFDRWVLRSLLFLFLCEHAFAWFPNTLTNTKNRTRTYKQNSNGESPTVSTM